ncbi:MAG: hypothetical protein ABH842_01260 [Candidatus Micrarchaeota archaeon]
MKKILLAFVLMFALSFAGISIPNYTVSKSSFQPNEQGVITVTVVNPSGTARVSTLTMSISNPYEITVTGSSTLSDIENGGTAIVSIPIKIKQDAKAGVYLVTMSFTGTEYSSGEDPKKVLNSVSIPVTVLSSPIFSFVTDTTSLSSIDNIVLNVSNNGGIAKNARIGTSGTISLYGTNEVFIGNIEGSQLITLQLDSRSASDGPEDLILVMTYEDELGTQHSDQYIIRMTVKKEKLNLAFSQTSELVTREEGSITLTIKNNGDKQLKDVRLTFTNSSLRFKDRNELLFGNIAQGASAEVNATLFADLIPGLNLVPATLSWVEEDVEKEELVEFPFTVSSDADVGIYLEAKPSPLMSSQEHTISVLVSNLGSYAIDNVDVEFISDSLESLDISSNQYIGSLNNDDFSTVQFKVRIGNVPEGSYPIKLNITYRDKSGEWKSKLVTKNVNVYSQPAQNGSEFILIGGLVIVVLAVWFFFIRKKPTKVG